MNVAVGTIILLIILLGEHGTYSSAAGRSHRHIGDGQRKLGKF